MANKIWFRDYSLEELNQRGKGNAVHHLGIEITELGPNYLCGRMPVDYRTCQPYGILHGGSSVLLAETLGSLASNLILDPAKHYAVGLDVNANHIRSVSEGYVTGKAILIHQGRSTHVWSIEIRNEQEALTCLSRLTMSVLPARSI